MNSNFERILMKAILHTKFGSPDELQLKEIDKPVPKDNEVLITVFVKIVVPFIKLHFLRDYRCQSCQI